jgi:ABC-type bacteriocin/lantibiotic exporter with double-glycine peptidase domain
MKDYNKPRDINMKRIEYIKELKRYIINDDEVDYKTLNIFRNPVIRLFFWKDNTEDIFFVLYKYKDKYFSISDKNGLYKIINEESEDPNILIILLNKIVIYDKFDDIYISKYKNECVFDEISYLRSFFVKV